MVGQRSVFAIFHLNIRACCRQNADDLGIRGIKEWRAWQIAAIRHIRLRARVEKRLHHLRVVHGGENQRHAIHALAVRVGLVRKQQLDDVELWGGYGQCERRNGRAVCPALTVHQPISRGLPVRIRPSLEQSLDDARALAHDSAMQRQVHLARVRVRLRRQQRGHGFEVAVFRREAQGRAAFSGFRVDVGLRSDELLERVCMAAAGRFHQGRAALSVGGVHVRSFGKEIRRQARVAFARRQMQRRRPGLVARVDVRLVCEQSLRDGLKPFFNRLV